MNKAIKDAFRTEVAEKVKEVESQKVEEIVYHRYNPPELHLPRRKEHVGLKDKRNMKHTISTNGEDILLEVKNMTDGNPYADDTDLTKPPNFLAGIIEYGRLPQKKGKFAYNRWGKEHPATQFLQPRPFTKETVRELKRTGEHVDVFIKGMKRNGFNLE